MLVYKKMLFMKNLKKIISTIFISAMLVSCTKDILEKTPLDQLSPEIFYSNAQEADMALMGVYASVVDHWFQYDFMSDNNYMHHAWQGSLEFSEWKHNSSSSRALNKWRIAYRTIARVNSFLSNIEDVPMDEELKARMEAEARFLRGMLYADLTFFYGDVPLILEVLPLEEAKIERTPKEQVLSSAIGDLEFAAENLPDTYSGNDIGRVTKGAALAFKTRVLLYDEQWEKAAQAAKEVIDMGVYSLYPDYEGLFKEENENNEEVIFDIQYMKDLRPQPWPSTALSFSEWPTPGVTADIIDSYYMTNGLPLSDPASGYNDQDPFKERDPRLMATFVLPGTPYGAITFIPANDTQPTGARPRKYADIENANKDNTGINWILMRYADVLLMRAEALIESGNTGQEVYDLINQVRQRPSVDMPTIEEVEGSGLNQEQLRDIVRHERRVEFAMEGTRYSDMRRWELESAVHDVYGYNTEKLADPNDPSKWVFERVKLATRKFDPQKGWLWPIPLEEIQNNSNLTQNTGY
jgi:hypothetical protein